MSLADHIKGKKKVVQKMWSRQPWILASGQIPKPMHGLAPRIVLGVNWWNRTRRAAYKSTNQHCQACGVHKYDAPKGWLEGHELYEVDYLIGRMEYLRTVPLCHFCHNFIHMGRISALLEQGKITAAKFAAIVQHGQRVLTAAKLKPWVPYEGPCADWGDWRLVIGKKEYLSLFECKQDWVNYHQKGSSDE